MDAESAPLLLNGLSGEASAGKNRKAARVVLGVAVALLCAAAARPASYVPTTIYASQHLCNALCL
jgi:hypothetical protein